MNMDVVHTLSCEESLDALGAFALGALDEDETGPLEAHLSRCAACRAAFSGYEAVVEGLAASIPLVTPAPEARDRLLEAARVVGPGRPPIAALPAAARPAPRIAARWLFPAMSVAATFLLIAAGILAVLLLRTIEQRDDARQATTMLSTYASAGGQVVALASQPVPEYEEYRWQGSLLTAPGRAPLIIVSGCPKSSDYMTYRVWFASAGERTGAGTLTVGDDGSGWLYLPADFNLQAFDTIGITVLLEDKARQDVLVGPLDGTL